MATYAELDTDNIVINVIVADAEFVATQNDKTYVQYTDENPAGIGYTYDAVADEFISPQPYPSWTRVNKTWQAPTPIPSTGGPYTWSEEDLEWVAV